jgi:hypothetical protein
MKRKFRPRLEWQDFTIFLSWRRTTLCLSFLLSKPISYLRNHRLPGGIISSFSDGDLGDNYR